MGLLDTFEPGPVKLVYEEFDEHGDKVKLVHAQRVDHILRANQEARKYSDEIWQKSDPEMKRVASIPLADYLGFLHKWQKDSGNAGEPPWEVLKKWLLEHKEFLTTEKRI